VVTNIYLLGDQQAKSGAAHTVSLFNSHALYTLLYLISLWGCLSLTSLMCHQ